MPSLPKTARREHSATTVAVVLKLHDLGYSSREITSETNVPKTTVLRIIKQRDTYSNRDQSSSKRTGRPNKLSRRAERLLLRHVANNPEDTYAMLSSPSKSGQRLHPKTIKTYLARNEVYAFKPRRKPFLTAKQKLARLKWAREYVKWTLEDWRCVIFSDESSFELGLDTRSTYVRRPLGKAFESRYLKPTFKSGRSSIGVWGSISKTMKGPLFSFQQRPT